ncbi:hypothetical protein RhiirA5_435576 [Rhizophagus irregularis]|uniref:Uncharacterized protein n=1 Tax=Rhizophagus irregularis TaxID=588596 RepID=A0A2I1DT97_9GLOM|nr:hypothetical protein RhiirA5_435576 [Rhizophagus irregularis]PKC54383.1 hypothetical protein RhiirA1_477422 [Rhizophagus irregularis]PKY13101.1 hypothetical protein RhiirB3_424847 [Rhizophagus irregularis]CAB4464988.1 unnamed protein product [Rhizophagus irregularis]
MVIDLQRVFGYEKSYIYSLDVIFWELTSCSSPFNIKATDDQYIMLKIVNGKEKILFQIQMINSLSFIKQHEPDKRPEIHQVISELKELDNIDSENNDALTSVNSIEYEITEDSENEDFDRFSDCDLSKLQPDEHDTLESNKFYRLTLNSITSRIDVEQTN